MKRVLWLILAVLVPSIGVAATVTDVPVWSEGAAPLDVGVLPGLPDHAGFEAPAPHTAMTRLMTIGYFGGGLRAPILEDGNELVARAFDEVPRIGDLGAVTVAGEPMDAEPVSLMGSWEAEGRLERGWNGVGALLAPSTYGKLPLLIGALAIYGALLGIRQRR